MPALVPMSARLVRTFAVAMVTGAIAACGTVPPAMFADYVSAYESARDAGLLLYDEIAPALREGGSGEANAPAFAASLGPDDYSRSPCATRYPDLPSLQARCDLLQAVTAYNQVLASLNQGASAAGVRATLGEVSASLGALSALAVIPQVGAVLGTAGALIGPLSGLVDTALTLSDRVELRKQLEQGAPTVQQAIAALDADVARMYDVQRAAYALRLQQVENEIRDVINPALRIANTRDRPGDASARIARRALDARFDAIFDRPEPEVGARLAELPLQPAGKVMSAEELVAIGDALEAAAPEVARFQATVDEWHVFLDALHAYDDLLSGVGESLTAMLAASGNPFVTGGGLEQLDGAIGAIRRDARTIREVLSGL